MASMPPPPPNYRPGVPPPPGGTPYGVPYGANPRDYWRYQKAQNKAAWRAQRDMMRAQSRANRVPSVAGPIILIAVGIIALLLITGRLNSDQFWTWYGHWWPLLLIGVGLVALAEWALDMRKENPPARRFGSYVGLIVFLIIIGTTAAGWHRFWGPIRAQFGDDSGDDFFNSLGQPQHDLDQAALTTAIPANAVVEIQNPRGDVSISAGDGTEMGVAAHQIAYAGSDADAAKIFDSQKAHVSVSGNAVLVKIDSNTSGRTNLTITLPKSASVNVTSGRGGVTVAGLSGNVDAEVPHGDLEATAIQGHVHGRMSGSGDFSAHDIQGDVTVEGSGGDLTLSDIHGMVTLQGEYSGDIHLERADKGVNFHSSRTDMQLGRLPGDMSMTMDSLHVTQVVGPVRIVTHSKDIEMSQVFGDTLIEDKNARVELEMAGSYPVEVKNQKGDVEVSLPNGSGVTVDARTRNGDVVSDFPLQISGDSDKTATGTIGKGGPQVTLTTEHADLRIRKGGDSAAIPPMPATPKMPSMPSVPAVPSVPKVGQVPHLKPSKSEAETVTQ